jgi:hypothetical protein
VLTLLRRLLPTSTSRVLAERVARGARLLDERGPADWRDRVDARTLKMSSGYGCVLGQLYGELGSDSSGFKIGLGQLGLNDRKGATEHGFTFAYGAVAPDWDRLTIAWQRRLHRDRRFARTVDATRDA